MFGAIIHSHPFLQLPGIAAGHTSFRLVGVKDPPWHRVPWVQWPGAEHFGIFQWFNSSKLFPQKCGQPLVTCFFFLVCSVSFSLVLGKSSVGISVNQGFCQASSFLIVRVYQLLSNCQLVLWCTSNLSAFGWYLPNKTSGFMNLGLTLTAGWGNNYINGWKTWVSHDQNTWVSTFCVPCPWFKPKLLYDGLWELQA